MKASLIFRASLLAALAAATSSAMALTLVQTATSSFSYTEGGTYGPLSFSNPILALSPSLGTLTAVDVQWTTRLDVEVFGTYSSTRPDEAFGATAVNVLDLGGVRLSRRNQAVGRSAPLGNLIIAGYNQTGSVSGSASDLAPFVGTGAVSPATWSSTVQTVGSNFLFEAGSIAGTVTGTMIVTYTYAPVPEPASLTVLGLGAVAFLKRRKKA